MGSSMDSFSIVIRVPSPGLKVESTRRGTLYLPANSTERGCSTLEPRLASSSISSKVTCAMRRALRTMRGSAV